MIRAFITFTVRYEYLDNFDHFFKVKEIPDELFDQDNINQTMQLTIYV